LFALCGLSFAFGRGLATYERPYEIQANNELMAQFIDDNVKTRKLVASVDRGYDSCLSQFVEDESLTKDALLTFMDECMEDYKSTTEAAVKQMEIDSSTDTANSLTYDWITCGKDEIEGSTHVFLQSQVYMDDWTVSYNKYMTVYLGEGLSQIEANDKAKRSADGSQECVINTVGGAIYWFTVMTTIGYGNTSVVSVEGRWLIFTLGFLSILLFSTVIGHAGYVMLAIWDHWFRRIGWTRWTKGGVAALFWLLMLILWIWTTAVFYMIFVATIYGDAFGDISSFFSWFDAVWFAYITFTTIGFGDYYIPHSTARIGTVFYVPLVILIGFVLLANFVLKLRDFLVKHVYKNPPEEFDNMREEQDNDNTAGKEILYDLSGNNDIKVPSDIVSNKSNHDGSISELRDNEDISFGSIQVDDKNVLFGARDM
jgi:hypothetical protein